LFFSYPSIFQLRLSPVSDLGPPVFSSRSMERLGHFPGLRMNFFPGLHGKSLVLRFPLLPHMSLALSNPDLGLDRGGYSPSLPLICHVNHSILLSSSACRVWKSPPLTITDSSTFFFLAHLGPIHARPVRLPAVLFEPLSADPALFVNSL